MKFNMFVSALLKFRNWGLLLAMFAVGYGFQPDIPMLPNPETWGPFAALGIYGLLAMQTLSSKKFQDEFLRKEKIKQIQDLNYKCSRLAGEAKRHTNSAYYQKLRKVMEDKNDIVNSFFRGEHSYLKERIVEQTLKLVISYTRLLTNFCIRSKELAGMDIGEVANRINANIRKMNFTKDLHTVEDIKRIIEMDEKIINRLKDEKQDLERISTKLDYMESTVNMFKHQILSSIETEDMVETLETAVSEATALDSVLEERRRNRISL